MTYVMLIYLSPHFIHGESWLFPPCEVASKSVVPAIKASIAIQLVESYNMRQKEVAALLGLSQSAVSKYTTGARGYVLRVDEIKEVKPIIAEIVAMLADGNAERIRVLEKFCEVCMVVRKKGLMCQFCEKMDPLLKIEKCNYCLIDDR